jgi:hypothetical protein
MASNLLITGLFFKELRIFVQVGDEINSANYRQTLDYSFRPHLFATCVKSLADTKRDGERSECGWLSYLSALSSCTCKVFAVSHCLIRHMDWNFPLRDPKGMWDMTLRLLSSTHSHAVYKTRARGKMCGVVRDIGACTRPVPTI